MKQEIKQILSIADKTYYNWKKEKRPIINLLEKYFSKRDLEEYLEIGEVFKLELLEYYEYELFQDVESFFNDFQDLRIEFLFSFLYLSKQKLLDKYENSNASFYDYYLYDILEEFKNEYAINANNILGIDDFNEQFKELHITLMKIKYPVYKYLIYNLKFDFSIYISKFSHISTKNIQDVVLMMPFLINNDFKNINKYKDLLCFTEDNLSHNISVISEIIKANNDFTKIEKIVDSCNNSYEYSPL